MVWYSPNHPRPEEPQPPREQGQRLATFPRGQEAEEELRVSLCEYQGHPFVSLRVWAQDDRGRWWPVKGKGLGVRIRECAGLAEALAGVAELLARGRQDAPQRPDNTPPVRPDAEAPGTPRGPARATDDRPRYVERRRQPPTFDPSSLPPKPPTTGGGAFDELAGG